MIHSGSFHLSISGSGRTKKNPEKTRKKQINQLSFNQSNAFADAVDEESSSSATKKKNRKNFLPTYWSRLIRVNRRWSQTLLNNYQGYNAALTLGRSLTLRIQRTSLSGITFELCKERARIWRCHQLNRFLWFCLSPVLSIRLNTKRKEKIGKMTRQVHPEFITYSTNGDVKEKPRRSLLKRARNFQITAEKKWSVPNT